MSWTKEDLASRLKENPDLSIGPGNFTPDGQETEAKMPGESKYHAQRTGHYASKKEAQYAAELELRKQAGEVSFWLEQVPFRLPGDVIYRLDFVVFFIVCQGCGEFLSQQFVEVKGRDLPMGKLKRKQVEEIYGIHIEVV